MDVALAIDTAAIRAAVDAVTAPARDPWEALERIARLYPNDAAALIARSALACRAAGPAP